MLRIRSVSLNIILSILLLSGCQKDIEIIPMLGENSRLSSVKPLSSNPGTFYVDLIADSQSTLDQKSKELLNRAFHEFINKDDRYSKMYFDILSAGLKIKFQINYDELKKLNAKAGYDKKTIMFLDRDAIRVENLVEEMIHYVQDNLIYPYGYIYTARKNIEFEAKVIQDYICHTKDDGCPLMGTFEQDSEFCWDYTQWILGLEGHSYLYKFNKLCERWTGYTGVYKPNFTPKLLFSYY